MPATFQLQIIDEDKKRVFVYDYECRVEIGRQDRGEPGPYSQRFEAGRWRLVVAPLTEDTVSRHHLSLEPLEDGRFRIRNGSKAVPIRLTSGDEVRPGETRDLPIPTHFFLGRKMIRVVAVESALGSELQELPEATLPPGTYVGLATKVSSDPRSADEVHWLRAAMEVLQAAANSSDFFEKAARAAVDLVGLDSASVWLLRDEEWVAQAYSGNPRTVRAPASRHVLNTIRRRAKTVWDKPEGSSTATSSLSSIADVVASPILDRTGQVIGALYGDRSFVSSHSRQTGGITEVHAMLVELLAGGIASGLERLRQEQAVVAARVQFEQFFTPDLALELERNPGLLSGRESELTILFCDIRGFQRVSRMLSPHRLFEWINDLLGALSECVVAHQGVLVDYNEDELKAMWGAPTEQPGHANLACQAAMAMLKEIPRLNEVWRETIGEEIGLSIGINSGSARVGNVGSIRKFKYGPLGPTVNLARRMQGVARRLRAGIVIGSETKAQLGEPWMTRRLGRFQLPEVDEREDLYEAAPLDRPGWSDRCQTYEDALKTFEDGNFYGASRILAHLRTEWPDDGPARWLLARSIRFLVEKPAFFDPADILDNV